MSMQEYTSVLLIAAIFFAGILVASPFSAVAQEQQQPQNTTTTAITASAGNTTTSSAAPSSGIKLSPQPIYQESVPPGSVTPINQTHIAVTHTGNGTLTLPNSNQTINVISNGSAIASLATPSAIAKETIRAPNGESELTAWRWESGIPLSTGSTATTTTTPAEDSPPPMETPTATDATADDTTATAPSVEGGEE